MHWRINMNTYTHEQMSKQNRICNLLTHSQWNLFNSFVLFCFTIKHKKRIVWRHGYRELLVAYINFLNVPIKIAPYVTRILRKNGKFNDWRNHSIWIRTVSSAQKIDEELENNTPLITGIISNINFFMKRFSWSFFDYLVWLTGI